LKERIAKLGDGHAFPTLHSHFDSRRVLDNI
jgi:hypothetical protein